MSTLRMPQPGEVAPNFTLPDIQDTLFELETATKPITLVFMRHLA
jgi:peroxiredoxin